MSFTGLAANQAVSYGNLQDAVNNGIFTLISTIPSPTNRESTKSVVSAGVSGFNPNYPPYASKTSNQLVVKGDIYNTGTVTLSPQYGMYFTAVSGTNIPSFSYPVNHLATSNYINQIPPQTISISLAGTRVTTPLNLSVYVDNSLISCQDITYNGAQTKTVTLPNYIYAPSSLFIAIDSGACSVTPPPPNFTNMAFTSAAISRNTGQYQVLAQTSSYYNTPGYLYTSSDYGSTWTQRGTYGYWSKIAISGDGQYMLAVEYGSGYAWKSSNYGASWYQITNFPAPVSPYTGGVVTALQKQNFKSAALSDNGAKQCIVTQITQFSDTISTEGYDLISVIWISNDYGVTWFQSPYQVYSRNVGYNGEIFNAVTMDSTGSYIYIAEGEVAGPYGFVFYSIDGGTNFNIASGSQNGANITDIATISDGSVISATSFSSQNYTYVLRSTNYGASFNRINHGSPSGIDQNSWYRCCIFKFNSTEVDTFITPNYTSPIFYSPINSAYTTPYVYPWTNTITQNWTSLNCSNSGTYMIMTARVGAWKSTNAGATFTQL